MTTTINQGSHRYQVGFRLLTVEDRKRVVTKEIEVERQVEVMQTLNVMNTVTESISVGSSDSKGGNSSQSSMCGDPTVASNQNESGAVFGIKRGRDATAEDTHAQDEVHKRRRIDSPPLVQTTLLQSHVIDDSNSAATVQKQSTQVKDDLSPPASFENLLGGTGSDARKTLFQYRDGGPSSVQAELGSTHSKTNTTVVDEVVGDQQAAVQLDTGVTTTTAATTNQEDIFSLLLARSPLVEDDVQRGDENAVISQDYHLMHLNMNKSPQKSASVDNSLEQQAFKIPDPLVRNVEGGDDSEKYLRKRNLKALDKQQYRQECRSQVITEKQKVTVTEELTLPENLHIWVKDLETLNLYEAFVNIGDEKFYDKLNKWVKGKKYSCLEHVTDDKLTLKVKIFTFQLYHHANHPQKQWNAFATNPQQYLLDEVKQVAAERRRILKELKLFQYFLFNVCPPQNELTKWLARVPKSQIQRYVEDPEQLFIRKEAIGKRESRNGHQEHYLVFTEEMCFDEEPQRYPNIFSDKLLIYGRPDFEFQVCPLKRREIVEEVDSVTSWPGKQAHDDEFDWSKAGGFKFKYNVSLPVHHNEVYSVYFPKIL